MNFKKIAGPGVPGTEEDVPVYHFDILDGEVPEMLADPSGFLSSRGIDYPGRSGRSSIQVTMIAAPNEKTVGDGSDGSAVRWCCYDVGEGRTCVRHN